MCKVKLKIQMGSGNLEILTPNFLIRTDGIRLKDCNILFAEQTLELWNSNSCCLCYVKGMQIRNVTEYSR